MEYEGKWNEKREAKQKEATKGKKRLITKEFAYQK